jgi:hypothetical protein
MKMADKIVEQEDEGPYGYGTTPAVNTLLKRVGGYKLPTQGLLMINIATLVRNTSDAKLKATEVADKVCSYMTNITTDYAAAMSRWTEFPHHVVYYWTDSMRLVPEPWRRAHRSEASLIGDDAVALLVKRFKDFKPQTNGGTTAHIYLGRQVKEPSYKGLVSISNSLVKYSATMQMISHIPVDWHVQRLGRLGIMYRSYTGTAIQMSPTELGESVFELKGIPFYPSTHVVLGDKNCIKSALVRQAKQEFIKYALKDRLVLRSESYVDSAVKKFMPTLPYNLK